MNSSEIVDALSRIDHRLGALESRVDSLLPFSNVEDEEAAHLLSCSVDDIRSMLRSGALRKSAGTSDSRRIPMTEIVRLTLVRSIEPTAPTPPLPGVRRPTAFTKKEAAKELGFSVAKLDRLIKAGVIWVCEGDKKMIPRAAIDAFAHPVSAAVGPRRSGRRPKKSTYNPLVDFAPPKRSKKR